MNTKTLTLLVVPWIALGVGLKLTRYAPEREASAPRAERLVKSFLEERGWRFEDRTRLTAAGVYAAQVFTKPGCPSKLKVVVLDLSEQATDVVRQSLGPETAFLYDGDFSTNPSPAAFAAKAVRAGLTLTADRLMPPLAVSPAPKPEDHSPCAPPPASEWIRIGEG